MHPNPWQKENRKQNKITKGKEHLRGPSGQEMKKETIFNVDKTRVHDPTGV